MPGRPECSATRRCHRSRSTWSKPSSSSRRCSFSHGPDSFGRKRRPRMDPVTGYLEASVRIATPLLWAAAGELVAERAGVINLGVEGAMLAGALAAALGAVHGDPWVGIASAALAG